MGVHDTPHANRLHIAIYGKRNSGKSTLLNQLLHQEVSLVSDIPGTTTDPVVKAMELAGIGPVVFYDTAGFDDIGMLGEQRNQRTRKMIDQTDIAILLFHEQSIEEELTWLKELENKHIPVLGIWNSKGQNLSPPKAFHDNIKHRLLLDIHESTTLEKVREALLTLLPQEETPSVVAHLIHPNDIVLLVMPQDIQAPKGRLILPQVQVIRELLDYHCIVQCCSPATMTQTLDALKKAPNLIICDSQVFHEVYAIKPIESKLTSFSVLFARHKGDIDLFVEGAHHLESLKKDAHILIAEACAHAPTSEDIGRVKLPAMLRKRFGNELRITIVNGTDFPLDLSPYDMIIHCGACMFTRTYVLNRVASVKAQQVPMSNYGIVIAWLQGILDKIIV